MRVSRLRPAPVIWVLALLVIVASGWVLLPFPRRPIGWEEVAWSIGFGMGFVTVGAILVDRRPAEPVSRITLGIGLVVIAAVALRAAAVFLEARPGDAPTAVGALAMLSVALQTAALMLGPAFLLVRFPAGREPGLLTNLVDAALVVMGLVVVITLFRPGSVDVEWLSSATRNPFGIDAAAALIDALFGVVLVVYAAGLGLAVAILTGRYRRSGPVVRAQIRWVAAAAVVPVPLLGLMLGAPDMPGAWTLWLGSTLLLPAAIGIAILRYRLFDIDRILSRSIAYLVVTAVLAAVFVVANLALQALLADITSSSTLAVAASTLLVATLFQPIHRRVQAPIDRRFNRARLDAERVIAAFVRETRDEVDLERLRGAAVRTVDGAVRPSRAGLWLRGPAA